MPGNDAPHIVDCQTPAGRCAQLRGRWGAAQLGVPAHWRALAAQLRRHPPAADLAWDLRALQWLDHVGAQLLWNHWQRAWPQRLDCSAGQRAMLARVAALSCAAPAPERWRLRAQIDQLGAQVLHAIDHARHTLELLGRLLLDLLVLARAPRRAPWRDVCAHLYQMGASALPITALVGFLIGVVLAYLMALQLRQFGAQAYIVNILGISLIRELGPMLAAILIAGRSGSAITAQIGAMRVTEELDAMRVMGIAHGFRLVLPRTLALALAMPLVSAWTTLAALAGGMLAADLSLGIGPAYFVQALPAAVSVDNLLLACAKSVLFGVGIALTGCHWGLRVKPDTRSLGAATTASVVTAITMVIVVDAVFAVLFKNVGI